MVKNTTLRYLLGVCMAVSLGSTSAQQFGINAGTINTCTGVLQDTGGPAGQYANNENFTAVICADSPGDAISLNWVVFTLSPTGPNPPDRVRIWDGNSTAATFLGEYTGTALQGLITSATSFNSSGCLTVQFISNGAGTGDFAASITCYTPCERPTADATMSEMSPAMICVGEVLDFDGNGSYAAATFNIASYTWDFDDGSTFSGPATSHSFAAPGEYIVQLFLLDDNDCSSANLVDLQVLVSTTPNFSGTVQSQTTCLGAIVNLNAVVSPVTWTGIPEANFGDGVYLPDDVGQPFTSELNFTQFSPGQTLTNVGDLLSICMSIEHSFMGDLVLSVTCPGGQSIILHQQGGGGTYFGDANDTDSNANPVPGVCWDYCWSSTATLPIMSQCSQFGPTPNTMPSSQGNALIPATYSSVQPWSNLSGCPLNGTWTFTSTDLWGADNGFLCSWSLNFNPAIIPDVTQFTPDPGTSTLDSAFWTGPFLTIDPLNPLSAVATPDVPGSYDYVFFVSDNFGCTYDTTITIIISPQLVVEAGPPIVLCSTAQPMAGAITANMPPGGAVTYVWSPTTGLTNPASPTTNVLVSTPTMFYLTAYSNGLPECGVTDSVLVSPDPSINAGISDLITLCASDPLIQLTDSLNGTPDAGGVWTTGAGGVIPNAFDPTISPGGLLTYTVTSGAGCVATSTLDITMLAVDDPTCCGVPDAGLPMFSCNLSIALSATPGNTGVGEWSGPANAVFTDNMATQTAVTMPQGSGGSYWFYWTENDGAFCNTIDSVLMTFTDAYVFTPTLTNALCYSYCDGDAQMAVTGGNALAGLTYAWSTGGTGVGLEMVTGLCAGDHDLTVTDDNGCQGTTTVTITEPILLEIDSLASQPVTCSGDCDGQVEIYDLEAVQYSFDDGASWSAMGTMPDRCEGLHQMRIQDVIGCYGTGAIAVTGPPPVIAEFAWGPNPANVDAPTIRFGNLSSGAERYFWNFADLETSTAVNPSFTFSEKEPGIYEVCLVAYNYNDCADTVCYNVIIDDVLFTYIPNSFTPDGDGVNDHWMMSSNIPVITDFEMVVFDRWGQTVYTTDNPYKPWQGSYQNDGTVLKSDVYVYRILYGIKNTEARKEIVGHVTLLK